MKYAGMHDLGAFGKLYDLIKYPEPTKSKQDSVRRGGAMKKEETKLFIRWCIR